MRFTAMRTGLAALALLMLAGAAGWAQMYNEAPMLAAMVKAGELPPVDERLPSNPLVVEPYDSIGTYGGTVHMMDVADSMSIGLRVRHTGLFRSSRRIWPPATPGRTTTVPSRWTLRDGLRWSDGEPFTTADLMFKWEHEILNEEIHPRGIDPF